MGAAGQKGNRAELGLVPILRGRVGYTLIELIIVMAIILILVAIAVPMNIRSR